VTGRAREVATLVGTFTLSFLVVAVGFGDWRFGLGFVLLILVHELGHIVEAKRQGLDVSLPVFIPLFGAYVTYRHSGLAPWRTALISLAGPLAGGIGAAVAWEAGTHYTSHWLVYLAYLGFLFNAANLLPVGFLDGGGALRGITSTWSRPAIRYENGVPVAASAPERGRAVQVAVLYVLLAAGLVAGMLATRHSGAF
jgi:Zn-dependent protease